MFNSTSQNCKLMIKQWKETDTSFIFKVNFLPEIDQRGFHLLFSVEKKLFFINISNKQAEVQSITGLGPVFLVGLRSRIAWHRVTRSKSDTHLRFHVFTASPVKNTLLTVPKGKNKTVNS